MPYINTIDINGVIYTLENLTDGNNIVTLPELSGDDIFVLRGNIVDNTSSTSTIQPLSARQGKLLRDDLKSEIDNRIADVSLEEQRALAAEQGLTDSLNAEIERATKAEADELTRAQDAEKVLTDNLTKEVADRVADVAAEKTRAEGAEKTLADNLAQEIEDRKTDVDAEEQRALVAEGVLTKDLDAEVTRATDRETEINTALSEEIDRAKDAEQGLTDDLNAEIERAKAAEQENSTAISTEKSRAEGVEDELLSRIETMEAFFEAADIDASKEFIDTLKEIQSYIKSDTTGAAAMAASIQANTDAIDETVRHTKQDLNEEQKAQARANIGVLTIDDITHSSDTLVWDGNTEGRTVVEITNDNIIGTLKFVHVSDSVPSFDTFLTGASYVVNRMLGLDPIVYDVTIDEISTLSFSGAFNIGLGYIVVIPDSCVGEELEIICVSGVCDLTSFPKAGIYFMSYGDHSVSSLTIPGYTVFNKKINSELLPNDVLTFNEQYLTEEQKAQARANIGVCDDSVIVMQVGDTLTWDGNTEGRIVVDYLGAFDNHMQYVHVSDAVLTLSDIPDEGVHGTQIVWGGIEDEWIATKEELLADHTGILAHFNGGFVFVSEEAVGTEWAAPITSETYTSVVFPKAGLYFYCMAGDNNRMKSITVPGYTGFVERKINPTLLHDVVNKDYVHSYVNNLEATISDLQDQIAKLKAIVESHHGGVKPDDE